MISSHPVDVVGGSDELIEQALRAAMGSALVRCRQLTYGKRLKRQCFQVAPGCAPSSA